PGEVGAPPPAHHCPEGTALTGIRREAALHICREACSPLLQLALQLPHLAPVPVPYECIGRIRQRVPLLQHPEVHLQVAAAVARSAYVKGRVETSELGKDAPPECHIGAGAEPAGSMVPRRIRRLQLRGPIPL